MAQMLLHPEISDFLDVVTHDESLELILENFARLAESGADMNVRIPLIPGLTDTEENLSGLAAVLEEHRAGCEVSLLPYNRFGEDKFERYGLEYLPGRLKTHKRTRLDAIRGMFEGRGFEVRIGG